MHLDMVPQQVIGYIIDALHTKCWHTSSCSYMHVHELIIDCSYILNGSHEKCISLTYIQLYLLHCLLDAEDKVSINEFCARKH